VIVPQRQQMRLKISKAVGKAEKHFQPSATAVNPLCSQRQAINDEK
jgi:hypothetical protein